MNGLAMTFATMAIAGLFAANPTEIELIPPCPFRTATGLHCPGCGSLRAVHHLTHGRVIPALRFNALTTIALSVLVGTALLGVNRRLLNRPACRLPLPTNGGWIALAIIVSFSILRNVPVYPLTMLAPANDIC